MLQKDQLKKLRGVHTLLQQQRNLWQQHPRAFFTLADRFAEHSTEDISETEHANELRRIGQVKAWGCSAHASNEARFEHILEAAHVPAFHIPLCKNQRRNSIVLCKCHHFDFESAQEACSFAAHEPATMLSKYSLLEPIRLIVHSAQPKLARLAANMLVRYLDTDCMHRLVASPVNPDIKFKIALSELQQRQPRLAELLNFQIHELNHVARGALDAQRYNFDDLSAALNDADVHHMAAAGELAQLPKWLQGLPCTSALNEAASIEVSCHAPTKVYMMCLSQFSHPLSQLKPPHHVTGAHASAWKFETSAKLFVRYDGMQASTLTDAANSQLKFFKSAPSDCLVYSTILDEGLYKLDTNDKVYFFDTFRHVKQQRLQASKASVLCKFMQSDGVCSAGDCCEYSHAPPMYYSPEVPVYISCMLGQCQESICWSLHTRIACHKPLHIRKRLYIKHKGYGFFRARRRVLPAGVTAALILRLVCPNATKCQARALAACHHLPQRIYSGLMAKADDFDDEDPAAFVESGGYRFRTLYKHRHSRQSHVLESGALFYIGGAMRSEYGYRELPKGWEICPPDDISIATCAQYSWQCTALALADLQRHATLGCMCHGCLSCDASGSPRQPHSMGSAKVSRTGCGLHVDGTDVLIRRPLCNHARTPAPALTQAAPESKNTAVGDLAVLLARCCLERATPAQQLRIRDFLDANEKKQDE
jgi:hypothetical protein